MKQHRDVPIPWCSPTCPLGWAERQVWGSLAWRDVGRSVLALSRMVPAARKTITTALATLSRCQLVEQRDRDWWAVEPAGQATSWFKARNNDGQDWHQSWAYWPCAIPTPECPLTSVGVGTFWVLTALKRWDRPTTIKGLAGFLGVDGRAVSRAVERLRELNLITTEQSGTRFHVRWAADLTKTAGWWQPKHAQEPPVPSAQPVEIAAPLPQANPPLPAKPGADQQAARRADNRRHNLGIWSDDVRELGVRGQLHQRIMRAVEAIYDAQGFPPSDDVIRRAAQEHSGAGHCGNLLAWKLEKIQAEVEKEAARIARNRKIEDEVLAPLSELGFRQSVPCPLCAERHRSLNLRPLDREQWPESVVKLAEAVKGIDRIDSITVGTRYENCRSCRKAWPGLVVQATRLRPDGGRVSCGYVLPDAMPVEVRECLVA